MTGGIKQWMILLCSGSDLAGTGSVSSISELQEVFQRLPHEEQLAMPRPDHTAALDQATDEAIVMLAGCREGCHQLLPGQAAGVTAGQDHLPPHLILLGWEGGPLDRLRPPLGTFEQLCWILQHGVRASHSLLRSSAAAAALVSRSTLKPLQVQTLFRQHALGYTCQEADGLPTAA